MTIVKLVSAKGHVWLTPNAESMFGSSVTQDFFDHVCRVEGKTHWYGRIAILNSVLQYVSRFTAIQHTEIDDYNGYTTLTIESLREVLIKVKANNEEIVLSYDRGIREERFCLADPDSIPSAGRKLKHWIISLSKYESLK